MGFEMFRLFVGHIPIETDGAVLSIDIETLETGTSRLLPHPNCPHCSKDNPEVDRVFLTNARMDTARENLDVGPKLRMMALLVIHSSELFADSTMMISNSCPCFRAR